MSGLEEVAVSIVIPCYNSEASIGRLADNVISDEVCSELILVNDGSSDGTWQEIQKIAKIHPGKVFGFNLKKNSGQHAALFIGIKEARGDVLVTMDDDLQHPHHEVGAMVAQVLAGADLVYGISKNPEQNFYRRVTSRFSLWLFDSILGMSNVAKSSAFRVFSKDAAQGFEKFRGSVVDVDAILSWSCSQVETREVRFRRREYGVSNYSFKRLLTHSINMVVAFSIVPLKVSLYLGLLTVLLAVILSGYFVYQYIFDVVVQGFTFLATAIMFFAGIQLLILGVIGQYLGDVHTQILGRPIAVIGETTASAREEAKS